MSVRRSSARGIHCRVVLIGLRGSGKSSIGRELAACLHVPFLDSDRELTTLWGQTPAQVIEQFGEAEWRRREARAIAELSLETCAVLALGGGAPIAGENRKRLHSWQAILLDAPSEVLARRISADPTNRRPPLTDLPVIEELERQRRERWPDYLLMNPTLCDTASGAPRIIAMRLAVRLQDDRELGR